MNSYYTPEELQALGLKGFGENVFVSRKASLYGVEEIEIGSNVRIDDFCFLSGKIRLGNYIHISTHTSLIGGTYGIEMQDFSGFSSHCAAYAVSDDYSGGALTNPMVPMEYRSLSGAKIEIGRHAIIGAGAILLPGASIGEGAAIGSLSLVAKSVPDWSISTGIPCRVMKERSRKLLELEKAFLNRTNTQASRTADPAISES